MIKVYFRVIKADLGGFSVRYERVQQLRVAAEERLQHRIVFFYGELPPGHLHASLQSTHILQDAIQRNYKRQRAWVQFHILIRADRTVIRLYGIQADVRGSHCGVGVRGEITCTKETLWIKSSSYCHYSSLTWHIHICTSGISVGLNLRPQIQFQLKEYFVKNHLKEWNICVTFCLLSLEMPDCNFLSQFPRWSKFVAKSTEKGRSPIWPLFTCSPSAALSRKCSSA